MKKIKIFISYARQDGKIVQELRSHLRALERSYEIELIYDAAIKAGQDWDKIIRETLEQADIILLIISAYFLSSDYTYWIE